MIFRIMIIAFRNIGRNPRRSLLTISAVAFGVWSSLTLSSLARGLSRGMADDAIATLTGHIQIHAPGYLDDPSVDARMPAVSSAQMSALLALPVRAWSMRVRVPGVLSSERESAPVVLVGADPQSEAATSFIGTAMSEGRFLQSPDDPGIVIGKKLLDLLETDLGKRIVVMSQSSKNKVADRGFRIVGVFDAELESTERSFAFVSLQTLQQMLDIGDELSEVSLVLHKPDRLDVAVTKIREIFPALDVQPWTEIERLITALLKLQGRFLVFWFIIVVIAISIGLINTLFMAVFERTREIGLLLCLGMRPAGVIYEVLFESIFLLLIGVLGGLAGALLSHAALRDGIDLSAFAAGAAHFGFRSIVHPVILPVDWMIAIGLILVIGSAASVYPAIKASRMTPIAALSRGS